MLVVVVLMMGVFVMVIKNVDMTIVGAGET